MRRIFRYEVPVDDMVHEIHGAGTPLAVGCRDPRVVEFWAINDSDVLPMPRFFTVVGTGHSLDRLRCPRHRGTAVAPGGALVWHLIEVES